MSLNTNSTYCQYLDTRELNSSVYFFPDLCIFQDLSRGKVKRIGKYEDGLYILNPSTPTAGSSPKCMSTEASAFSSSTQLWHLRLGHAPTPLLKIPVIKNLLLDTTHYNCHVCPLAKQTRLSFPTSISQTTAMFDLVHADVWGPYRVPTYNGFKYFLTLVDDFSRMTWTFLLRLKSDVFVVLNDFILLIENQFSTTLKVLRYDNGYEFNNLCTTFFKSKGIKCK